MVVEAVNASGSKNCTIFSTVVVVIEVVSALVAVVLRLIVCIVHFDVGVLDLSLEKFDRNQT